MYEKWRKKNYKNWRMDIWRRRHWFPREMTSVEWLQKFHTDDVS